MGREREHMDQVNGEPRKPKQLNLVIGEGKKDLRCRAPAVCPIGHYHLVSHRDYFGLSKILNCSPSGSAHCRLQTTSHTAYSSQFATMPIRVKSVSHRV